MDKEIELLKLENKSLKLLQRLSDFALNDSEESEIYQAFINEIAIEFKWPVGHVYFISPDDPSLLIPGKIWYLAEKEKYQALKEVTENTSFKLGKGLPGRVLESSKPASIQNIMQDTNFPRKKQLSKTVLGGAIGVPILINETVIAVLEFFSEKEQTENASLTSLLVSVGKRLGSIIENKKLVDQTKELALRLDLALNTSGIGVWDINLLENKLIWDNQMYKIYGVEPKNFNGAYDAWVKGLHVDDKEASENAFTAALLGKKKFEPQFRVVWPDGTVKTVQAKAKVLRNELNEPIRVVGVNWDISQQKEDEKRLQKSIKIAESALEARSRFLATMSHEIRTPLNGILSCSKLLADSVKKNENITLLDTIQTCGDTLIHIVNDILDFSKIEANKIDLELQPFHINEQVNSIINILKPKASASNKRIIFHIDESKSVWIKSDVTRFRQIVLNLMTNAIKFSADLVEISLSVKKREKNKVEIIIAIKDNGIGIAVEEQKKLFQSFSQVDASTTRKYGGTGLGLAISKGIVDALNGKIWVESEINSGSVFAFRFIAEASDPIKNEKVVRLSDIYPNMAKENPLRILMAEDNAVNQMVGKKLLKKLGYHIDVVANGIEALEVIKLKKYDLILMDQHMPEMDGIETTIKICADYPKSQRPRIVAITASALKEDKDRCFAAGMEGFIAKPIRISEVISELLKCQQITYREDDESA